LKVKAKVEVEENLRVREPENKNTYNMKYNSFIDMPVWNEAVELSVKVFRLTIKLPRSEDYGLTSQLRRSANSISANLAEGFGRRTMKDKSHFYIIARGSAFETQSHILYGNKVSYIDKKESNELFDKYNSLIYSLNKLIKSLNS